MRHMIGLLLFPLPQGKLYYYPLGQGEDTISVLSPETLQVEGTLELDGRWGSGRGDISVSGYYFNAPFWYLAAADSLGPQCLFSDGASLGQIKAKKEVWLSD